MKKLITAALLLSITLSAQKAYSQIHLGGGVVFGTSDFVDFGFDFRGDYRITDNWVVTPNINVFLNKSQGTSEFKTGLTTINFDGHYLFPTGGDFTVYPLAGINISIVRAKFMDVKSSNTEIGLNLGGGFNYAMDENKDLFFETKYVIVSDLDQLVFAIGILVGLN